VVRKSIEGVSPQQSRRGGRRRGREEEGEEGEEGETNKARTEGKEGPGREDSGAGVQESTCAIWRGEGGREGGRKCGWFV